MLVKGTKMNQTNPNKKKIDSSLPIRDQLNPKSTKVPIAVKPKQSFTSGQMIKNQQKIDKPKMEIKQRLKDKEEQKKQQKDLRLQKLQDDKNELHPIQQLEEKKQVVNSQITIRYNHYKDIFYSTNGILSFQSIEQKYSFGDVFKGNFIPILKDFKSSDEISPQTCGNAVEYSWKVVEKGEYRLQIQEDEQEESKHEKKIYKAQQSGLKHCACNLKNRAFHDLTAEMKKLQPHQLGGAKHRELLQQRDLEDILYSK